MRAWGVVLAVAVLLAGAAGTAQAKDRGRLFGRGGRIRGYLVTPAGQGLRGTVALCTEEGHVISTHPTIGRRRGWFEIRNLAPGLYTLRVMTVGPVITDVVVPEPVEVEVERGKRTSVKLIAGTNNERPDLPGVPSPDD